MSDARTGYWIMGLASWWKEQENLGAWRETS